MERVFLRSLAKDPRDHLTRGVYADWLEEHRPPQAALKAEFLRMTAVAAQLPADDEDRDALEQRLQTLAAGLSNDWLRVVSCLPIENCHVQDKKEADLRRESPLYYVCDRRWEDLRPTAAEAVRFCDACREQVYFCGAVDEARRHARSGNCVALSPHLARRDGQLAPPDPDDRIRYLLGGPHPSFFEDPPHDEEAHPTPLRREPQRHLSVTEQRRQQGRSRGA